MDDLNNFLAVSNLAKRIKVKPRVILQRNKLSAKDILFIKKEQVLEANMEKYDLCELTVDGKPIALGRIIKRRGQYFFKVKKPLFSIKPDEEVSDE